jgi:hypothetical protein
MHDLGIFFPSGIGNAIIFSDYLSQINETYNETEIFVMQTGAYELFKLICYDQKRIKFTKISSQQDFIKSFKIFKKFGIYGQPNLKTYLIGFFSSKNLVVFDINEKSTYIKTPFHNVKVIPVSSAMSESKWAQKFVSGLTNKSDTRSQNLFDDLYKDHSKSIDGEITISMHLGCHPMATHKRWHVDSYVRLIQQISNEKKIKIKVLGSEDDKEITDIFISKLDVIAQNLVAKTSLYETGREIWDSNLFISGDSGMMHFAAKIGIPQIGIFNNQTGLKKNIPMVSHPKSRFLLPENTNLHKVVFPGFDIVKKNTFEIINEIY